MNNELKLELINRLKSLGYRIIMVSLFVALDFLAQNLASLNLPDVATVILGLLAAEGTKYLKNSGYLANLP